MTCLIWNQSSGMSNQGLLDKLFSGENIESNEDEHVWHSKNKYYSSKIRLKFCSQRDQEEPSKPAESNVGACIWYCESPGEADDAIKSLDNWQDDLRKRLSIEETSKEESNSREDSDEDSEDIYCPVEIQLVVVESFQTEDSKTKVLQWTLKRGIEIIDLSEDDELQNEQNVSVFASSGQKRVLEALQTVMWPQLCPPEEEAGQGENEMNREMEDFDALFANLASFKEAAASLPNAERKKFAEKVAISFYSALGEGEDSSEEEEGTK